MVPCEAAWPPTNFRRHLGATIDWPLEEISRSGKLLRTKWVRGNTEAHIHVTEKVGGALVDLTLKKKKMSTFFFGTCAPCKKKRKKKNLIEVMAVMEGKAAGHRRRFDSMSHAARFCRCIAAERADGRAGGHSSKGKKKQCEFVAFRDIS